MQILKIVYDDLYFQYLRYLLYKFYYVGIIKKINNSGSDILAVALGSPKGEKFIYRIRNNICVALSISIGATIDFEAGNVKRSPRWMSNAGLEWLYRITQDPKRLIKRYWNDAVSIIPIIKKYGKKVR